ncbi:MAG: DNA-binding protein [Crocinitomicaceae bacterium]|jgi:hypothetical protein|nr:DNA-binding protein [Crocinitomicaceae bacterium]
MYDSFIIPDELVISKIYLFRGKKVMLDSDLASLYGVETRQINQAVKRNEDRFPADFMFQLTENEFEILMSQNAIPSAFTRLSIYKASGIT